jgi:hypothetical protein
LRDVEWRLAQRLICKTDPAGSIPADDRPDDRCCDDDRDGDECGAGGDGEVEAAPLVTRPVRRSTATAPPGAEPPGQQQAFGTIVTSAWPLPWNAVVARTM